MKEKHPAKTATNPRKTESQVAPPSDVIWLLKLCLPRQAREEILGDLAEEYHQLLSRRGSTRARLWYWQQALSLSVAYVWDRMLRRNRESRDERREFLMTSFFQDLRYGVRTSVKRPGFTAIVILTLALGIGANTAIFSVVNAVLLRSLPYEQAERLVMLRASEAGKEGGYFSFPDFGDLRQQNQTFAQSAAIRSGGWTLTGAGEAERIPGARVSASFFPMLGLKPALGRVFSPDEDRPGAERVVMLHYRLWQRRFGGDPQIIGQKLQLNGYAHTVIGVLPPDFDFFPLEISIATLYGTLAYEGERLNQREARFLAVFAKLKPDATLPQAQAEANAITRRLAEQFPNTNAQRSVKLVALQEQVVGSVRLALWVLLGAVAFVLLIACANAANLLLAQAAARRKEMAIRAALGASRWRVLRQLLTESLLLAALGGALGLLLAYWGVEALTALNPRGLPRLSEINLDSRVLFFTGGIVLLTSVIFGFAPAWQTSELDLTQTLKESGQAAAGSGRSRLRHTLVMTEVALALVLLIGAGLLIRSFSRLLQVDLGFNPQNVLKLTVSLPATQSKDDQQKIAFIERALEHVKALPGVESVAAANVTPLSGYAANLAFNIEGRPPALPGEQPNAEYRAVSADYLNTLGISVRRGRSFTAQDLKQPLSLVINEALAQRYFPNEDPLGKHISLPQDGDQWREIVGLVGDVRHAGIEAAPLPELYVPTLRSASGSYDLLVRSTIPPQTLTSAIRAEFRQMDANLPLFTVRTLAETVLLNLARQRFAMLLLSTFAVLALALAAIGLYGVMAYAVTQRTREIGLRMALGARSGDVVRMVLGEALRWVLWGGAIGLAVALALTRVMESLLYGVSATDPVTFAGLSLLLVIVALIACYLPARRAAKADPMAALRIE